jgi:hypothetical protein
MPLGEAMKKPTVLSIIFILLTILLAGCGGSAENTNEKSFNVILTVKTDDGEPLEGVRFTNCATNVGTSNSKGILSMNIRGAEGQRLTITTTCPEGYVGPEQPSTFKLTEVRRVNQSQPVAIGLDVTCTRKLREIVVVVRATDAPSLPVDIGGKTVGTIDQNGISHVRVQLDRDVRSLSVSLGTSDFPALRPQNPSRVYDLDGKDAVLLLDQTFSTDKKFFTRRKVAPVTATAKHIPYKIDSGRSRGF